MTARPKTADEVRAEFLDTVRSLASYWAHVPGRPVSELCDGVAFSILTLIDGHSSMPAFRLTVSPHPDDEAFHRAEGENWYPAGLEITAGEVPLHDQFYPPMKGDPT